MCVCLCVCVYIYFELFYRVQKTIPALEKQLKNAYCVKGSFFLHIELKLPDIYIIQFKYTSIFHLHTSIEMPKQGDMPCEWRI